jgi:hypothetical protein
MKDKVILSMVLLVLIATSTTVIATICIAGIPAYAQQSKYDSDGFTIFPSKSRDYMLGYRAGVIQADKDVQLFNADKLSGIDAHQDKIKCPPNSFNADFCLGYKDGYSDEAMDQLE